MGMIYFCFIYTMIVCARIRLSYVPVYDDRMWEDTVTVYERIW